MAKNGGSRMMLEFIHGAIKGDPHLINGISQVASNGFDTDWRDWIDINAMVAIVDQHLGKNTDYQSLCRVHHSLRLNKLFKKNMYKEHFFTKMLFKKNKKTYQGEYAPEKMERIYFGEISK